VPCERSTPVAAGRNHHGLSMGLTRWECQRARRGDPNAADRTSDPCGNVAGQCPRARAIRELRLSSTLSVHVAAESVRPGTAGNQPLRYRQIHGECLWTNVRSGRVTARRDWRSLTVRETLVSREHRQ
jgi:hypothetical protein